MAGSASQRGNRPSGPAATLLAGAIAALAWIAAGYLLSRGGGSGWGLLTLVLPVLPIALATWLAMRLDALRREAAGLRAELDAMRQQAARLGRDRTARAPGATVPDTAPAPQAKSAPAPARPARTPPEPTAARADPPTETRSQPGLPLDPGDEANVELTLPDLIRALHFPETRDDRQGLRALARALRHHKAGLVVQAAQDMLTLLSQQGIYMDDLAPPEPPTGLWRRLAAGDRSADLAAFADLGPDGHNRDPDQRVARCAHRLRDDTVFRDTAHHFLRRFDRMLADMVPDLEDPAIEALAATRSARAFRLVGAAAGMFDRG